MNPTDYPGVSLTEIKEFLDSRPERVYEEPLYHLLYALFGSALPPGVRAYGFLGLFRLAEKEIEITRKRQELFRE